MGVGCFALVVGEKLPGVNKAGRSIDIEEFPISLGAKWISLPSAKRVEWT